MYKNLKQILTIWLNGISMTKSLMSTIEELEYWKYSLASWLMYNQNTFPFINQIRYYFLCLCSNTLSETVSDYLCYNNRFATLAYVFGLDHPHKAASACCWSTILWLNMAGSFISAWTDKMPMDNKKERTANFTDLFIVFILNGE